MALSRYPYHRYLRYLILEGDGVDEISGHLADLGFTPPPADELRLLVDTLRTGRLMTAGWRRECDVVMFDDDSRDLGTCYWLVETSVARAVAERLLLDGVNLRHCAQVLRIKFGREVSDEAVSLFRDGFWDTKTLTLIDFAAYYELGRGRKPDPPPKGVPLALRPAFAAWDNGVIPGEDELATDDIVRAIQVDAYMRYARASTIPSPQSQDEARKWAAIALKVSAVKAKTLGKKRSDLPDLRPAVYYPAQHVPTLAELAAGDDPDDHDPDDAAG